MHSFAAYIYLNIDSDLFCADSDRRHALHPQVNTIDMLILSPLTPKRYFPCQLSIRCEIERARYSADAQLSISVATNAAAAIVAARLPVRPLDSFAQCANHKNAHEQ